MFYYNRPTVSFVDKTRGHKFEILIGCCCAVTINPVHTGSGSLKYRNQI
jgi:hypothetical protein